MSCRASARPPCSACSSSRIVSAQRRSSRAIARPRCRPPGASLSLLTVVFCGSSPRARRWDLLGLMDPVGKGICSCSLARLLPWGCCRCFWIFFPYRILCNPNVARPPRPLQGAGRAGTKPYRAYKAYSVFVETSQAAPLLASRQLIKTSNVTTFRRVM